MNHRFLTILTIFSFSAFLKANEFFDGYLLSPNATHLGQYGDVPVSYYSGKAQISIPLLSSSQLGVGLDISLSYDGSGIIMNSLPGWVGHNWTIQCGGCISRIKNDTDDEYEYPTHFKNFYLIPDSGYGNYFKNCKAIPDLNELTTASSLHNDYSADIFMFNFMGISGRFFMGNDGHWKVDCERNIKIVFDYKDETNYLYPFYQKYPYGYDYPKTIKGFTLIDENGIKYIFGSQLNPETQNSGSYADATSSIEYSIPFSGIGCDEYDIHWTAMSWYLTSIKDRFDRPLYEFFYSRGYFITECHRLTFSGQPIGEIQFPYSLSLTSPVYLDSIKTYDNNTIHFNFQDAFQTDKTIYGSMYEKYSLNNLFSASNGYLYPCKVNAAGYSYFYLQDTLKFGKYHYKYPKSEARRVNAYPVDFDDPLQVTALKMLNDIEVYDSNGERRQVIDLVYSNKGPRMHLTGVKISNGSNRYDVCYTLNYNTWTFINKEDYVTTNTDHWGYFKKISNLIKDDRLSCKDVTSLNVEGLLCQIIYPTGGCACFDYEQNQYTLYRTDERNRFVNCAPTYAGGVRIKKIRIYEDEKCQKLLSSKSFVYTDGQLNAIPKYQFEYTLYDDKGKKLTDVNEFRSESILQLKNSFGSPVGYSSVKEMRSDGTYDIYRYSNLSDTPIDICNRSPLRCSDVTPYDSFSEKNFYRGLLLSKRTYDKTNRLCAVDSLTYRRLSDEDETYYSVFNLNVGWISWYRWISSLPHLFKRDEFIEGMMVKQFHCLCAKNLIYFPKYDVVKIQKETYYPIGSFVTEIEYDKRDLDINEGESTVRKCFSETTKLISNGTPKETHVIKSGYESFLSDFHFPLSTTQEIINGEITNTHKIYYKCLAGNHYVPSSEIVSCGTSTTNYGNDGNTVITYNTYDEMGNLLKYTKTGCFQTTLTWNKYGKLIQRTQGNMTQTYTYDSVGQLESITEPNGNRTSFVYDYLGRLIQKSDKTGILQKIHYHYMK